MIQKIIHILKTILIVIASVFYLMWILEDLLKAIKVADEKQYDLWMDEIR